MAIVTKTEVVSVKDFGNDIKEFILKPEKYKKFEAGTFLQLTLDPVSASDYWPESRTFSIASYYNDQKTIRLLIKKSGAYTARMFEEMILGKTVTIKYPYGDFLLPQFDKESPIICVAGGTGLAPIMSFIESIVKNGGIERLSLLYSARFQEDLFYPEYLQSNILRDNLKIFITRQKTSNYINRRIEVSDILDSAKGNKDAHYYLCGSKEFISFFRDGLENGGAINIHFDEWE